MTTKSTTRGLPTNFPRRGLSYYSGHALAILGVNGLGLMLLAIFLLPLGYSLATSLKLDSQMTTPSAPLWPAAHATYNYQGQDYPRYDVPRPGGGTQRLALVNPYREDSTVIDTDHQKRGVFDVRGRWRPWQPVYRLAPTLQIFIDAWQEVDSPRLFTNSLLLAGISTIGTLLSCILVAYGFTRFK